MFKDEAGEICTGPPKPASHWYHTSSSSYNEQLASRRVLLAAGEIYVNAGARGLNKRAGIPRHR